MVRLTRAAGCVVLHAVAVVVDAVARLRGRGVYRAGIRSRSWVVVDVFEARCANRRAAHPCDAGRGAAPGGRTPRARAAFRESVCRLKHRRRGRRSRRRFVTRSVRCAGCAHVALPACSWCAVAGTHAVAAVRVRRDRVRAVARCDAGRRGGQFAVQLCCPGHVLSTVPSQSCPCRCSFATGREQPGSRIRSRRPDCYSRREAGPARGDREHWPPRRSWPAYSAGCTRRPPRISTDPSAGCSLRRCARRSCCRRCRKPRRCEGRVMADLTPARHATFPPLRQAP